MTTAILIFACAGIAAAGILTEIFRHEADKKTRRIVRRATKNAYRRGFMTGATKYIK